MIENKIEYVRADGEAAIYGPKMDLVSKDSLGREWQISTIQLDFIMPQRFGLKYTDKDGSEKTPVMIHRAIVGSPERFMGILIEHYAGNFPLWLSPVQVKVIPVRDTHNKYAEEIFAKLKEKNIRAELDDRDLNLGKRVHAAKDERVPYWLVLGDKEVESGTVTLESRDAGRSVSRGAPDEQSKDKEVNKKDNESGAQVGQMKISEILEKLQKEIVDKGTLMPR